MNSETKIHYQWSFVIKQKYSTTKMSKKTDTPLILIQSIDVNLKKRNYIAKHT